MFKSSVFFVIAISLLLISSLMGSDGGEQWPKRVLITNDNGIDDIKIIKLACEFSKIAETYIVAPSKDRSGATNYTLSLKEGKISVEQKNIDDNFKAFAVEGFPADCILVGLAGIMRDNPPDLVVSGINGGPNLAFEWIGSGTIGAARMASLSVPAIAVSGLDDSIPGAVEAVSAWVVEFAQSELVRNLEKNQYLTISVPSIPFDQIRGVRLAKRAGLYVDFRFMNDEEDSSLWVMRPVPLKTDLSKETDLYLYNSGYIAVVPMRLDEHDYELYDRIKLNPEMLKQIKNNGQISISLADFDQKEDTMFLGLRTVVYYVDDLEKAKKWYTKAFGVEPYFDEPFYVGFDIGGFELGLHPGSEGIHKGNNVAVYWGVANIDTAYVHLLDMGAKENEPVRDVGGDIKVATFLDPFGNLLGIIENPHFKKK